MINLDDLHDATFVSVTLQWAEGVALLDVRHFSGDKKLIIKNFTKIKITRNFDWGVSHQINEIVLREQSLVVEIQSGDTLEFFGKIEIEIN